MKQKAIIFDVAGVIFNISRDGNINPILETINFIEEHADTYDFFTNSSLSQKRIAELFQKFGLETYFMEYLSGDSGNKYENISYILKVYGYKKENILFIDDTQSNLDEVAPTGVHTLLFIED